MAGQSPEIGKVYKFEGFTAEILSYTRPKVVLGLSTGEEIEVYWSSLRKGLIHSRMEPKIAGIGFLGVGPYSCGEDAYAYSKWTGIITRSAGEDIPAKYPEYVDVVCDPEWYNFQNFARWFYSQKGHDVFGWHIDKDLLSQDSKIYGPDTCCIIPQEINNAIPKDVARGNYPRGLKKKKGYDGFFVRVGKYGKKTEVGYYKDEQEAIAAYIKAKEDYIKELAETFKDQIEPRVYEALMNYKV